MLGDKLLDLVRGKAPAFGLEAFASIDLTTSFIFLCSFGPEQRALNVIAVTQAVVDSVGRRKRNARRREEQSRKQAGVLGTGTTVLSH